MTGDPSEDIINVDELPVRKEDFKHETDKIVNLRLK